MSLKELKRPVYIGGGINFKKCKKKLLIVPIRMDLMYQEVLRMMIIIFLQQNLAN